MKYFLMNAIVELKSKDEYEEGCTFMNDSDPEEIAVFDTKEEGIKELNKKYTEMWRGASNTAIVSEYYLEDENGDGIAFSKLELD